MATSDKSTTTTADIESQIGQIRTDIADLTRMLKQLAEVKVAEAKAMAGEEADHIAKRTRDMAAAAQGRAREASESLESQIREKPFQSTLIALVIGLLLGALSRR